MNPPLTKDGSYENCDPCDRAIVLYARACHTMKAKDWARARACLDTLNPFREPWNGTISHPHWDSQYRDRIRIRFHETLSELEAILVELGRLGRARETETELSHSGSMNRAFACCATISSVWPASSAGSYATTQRSSHPSTHEPTLSYREV